MKSRGEVESRLKRYGDEKKVDHIRVFEHLDRLNTNKDNRQLGRLKPTNATCDIRQVLADLKMAEERFFEIVRDLAGDLLLNEAEQVFVFQLNCIQWDKDLLEAAEKDQVERSRKKIEQKSQTVKLSSAK